MHLLNKLRYYNLPYYGPDDENGSGEDNRTPVQKERDSIKVTSGGTDKSEETDNGEDENNLDENSEGEEEGEEGDKEDDEEGEEDDEKEEPKELTAEQKQIKALERKLERLQKRVGKTAGERDTIKRELASTKAALEAKLEDGTQPLTEEEVNRRARELANNELNQKEFERAQEKLIRDAKAIDKNFMSKVQDMAEEVAPLPPFFIGALDDLDNGGEVLNYLSDNHDEYEDLLGFVGKPTKVIKGLIEISNKLAEAKKPKPKKISQAPEPAKPPKGGTKSPDQLPPNPTKNMKEFVELRNRQEIEKRKARLG